MNDHNGHDSSGDINVLFTFACGAIAGAAVALMFAPARGRETREFLAQGSRRVKDKSREMLGEHGERLSAAVERGRDTAVELSERLGHAVEQGKAGYREAVRQGKDAASDAMQDVEQTLHAVRSGSTRPSDSTN
jgi:gas vesicle protein